MPVDKKNNNMFVAGLKQNVDAGSGGRAVECERLAI